MDTQGFYMYAKSMDHNTLESIAQAINKKEFEPEIINELLENTDGKLSAALAPTILANYIDDLTEKASVKLNQYLAKNQLAKQLKQATHHFMNTYQENNQIITKQQPIQTKKGPAILQMQFYGNGPAIAQLQQRIQEIKKIQQELEE